MVEGKESYTGCDREHAPEKQHADRFGRDSPISVEKLSDIDDGQHGVYVAKVGVDKFLTYSRIYHSKTVLGFSVLQGRLVHVGRSGSWNEVVLCAWYIAFIADVQNAPVAIIVAFMKKTSAPDGYA